MVNVTLESLYAMIQSQGKRQDRMEHEMEDIKNRLPVWVTVVFTILGSLVTGLLTKMVG